MRVSGRVSPAWECGGPRCQSCFSVNPARNILRFLKFNRIFPEAGSRIEGAQSRWKKRGSGRMSDGSLSRLLLQALDSGGRRDPAHVKRLAAQGDLTSTARRSALGVEDEDVWPTESRRDVDQCFRATRKTNLYWVVRFEVATKVVCGLLGWRSQKKKRCSARLISC